jgi:hypothetical protein
MPKGMQPIYTQNITGTVSTVSFNNIPQNYTDLKLIWSGRSTNPNNVYFDAAIFMTLNNDAGSNYGRLRMYSVGSGTGGTDRTSNATSATLGLLTASDTLANVFSNGELHIPNYFGTRFKTFVGTSVCENNTTAAVMQTTGGVWKSNAPITSIQISGTWTVNSSITLYGISQ